MTEVERNLLRLTAAAVVGLLVHLGSDGSQVVAMVALEELSDALKKLNQAADPGGRSVRG